MAPEDIEVTLEIVCTQLPEAGGLIIYSSAFSAINRLLISRPPDRNALSSSRRCGFGAMPMDRRIFSAISRKAPKRNDSFI